MAHSESEIMYVLGIKLPLMYLKNTSDAACARVSDEVEIGWVCLIRDIYTIYLCQK